ncbi:cytochrome P450 [Trametes sanguinea]|nr:cytochrome P450 [Trametes sanguinea]
MLGFTYLLAVLVAGAVLVVVLARRSGTPAGGGKRLPPGPGGLLLLGSVHKMPVKYQEKQFFEQGKQYGDVIYLKLFRTPTIVLNSLQAATDVLTKRSAKHSDRPRMVLLAELMNQASSMPAMPYGERFRKHRRWMHEAVGTKERLDAYRSIQRREARNLLKNFLNSPERFIQHCHLYVAATMLEIAYGKRVSSLQDELVAVADRAISGINEAGTPGAMIVDFFPSLKSLPTWLPGVAFKARALAVGRYVQVWKDTGYDMVRASMDRGDPMPCVTATLLEEVGATPTPEEAEDIKGLGCSVYGAGIETTRGALIVFMLAMTRNPEVLRKAQEEVDSVVGYDRLPDFDDRVSLPYLEAILEELYRWNPPLPLAIPHRSMAEDEYRGYTIPEGCLVMPNIWAITRDPVAYPDPEEFRPERFTHLTGEGSADADIPLPSSYVFGFGRRICPGQALADPTLWLAVAQIIAAFDIRKPLDAEGDEVTPPAAFKSGFTSEPEHFQCRIVPRSERLARVLGETVVS